MQLGNLNFTPHVSNSFVLFVLFGFLNSQIFDLVARCLVIGKFSNEWDIVDITFFS